MSSTNITKDKNEYGIMEYNIIDDTKKTRVNVALYDLFHLLQQRAFLIKPFKPSNTSSISSSTSTNSSNPIEVAQEAIVEIDMVVINATSIKAHSRYKTPPFLLTFEIFNHNVHNYLVDSGASTNVMPLLVCKKINTTPGKNNAKIIQLERG